MTVKERVEAEFDATGARSYSNSLGVIAQAASGVGGVLSRVLNVVNPLNLAMGALAGGGALFGVAQLGSEFENMRIGMAQTLRFIGVSSGAFSESLNDAESVIQRVYTAAAALPGEAEDYAEALRLAGTNVNRAVGDFDESFTLIRDMTAIGASMGRASSETAQFLNRALDTTRGMLEQGSDYTVELVNAMRNLPGLADITVQKFNHMKLEERVALLNQLTGQYADMIEASSGTWDAVAGAAATTWRTMARMATGPLFQTMTTELGRINDLFVDGNGELTRFGEILSQAGAIASGGIGRVLDGIADGMVVIANQTEGWLGALAESPVLNVLGNLMGGAQGAFAGLSMGAGGIFDSLGGVVDTLMGYLEPWSETMGKAIELFGHFIGGVLPGVIEAFNLVGGPIFEFIGGIYRIVGTVMDALWPSLMGLGDAFGALIEGVASVIGPILRIFGHTLLTIYDILWTLLKPAFEYLAEGIMATIQAIGDLLKWIGEAMGEFADDFAAGVRDFIGASGEENAETTAMRAALDNFLDGLGAAGEDGELDATTPNAPRTPAARGGGKTVQDFRYSRFDIQQKFEEGFDPDRIAAAFASDIGRLGEQRLQSGFEPLFAVR